MGMPQLLPYQFNLQIYFCYIFISIPIVLLGVGIESTVASYIQSVLRQKSNGLPSWCEQLLTQMVCEGVLKIIPAGQAKTTETMVIPEEKLIGGQPIHDQVLS